MAKAIARTQAWQGDFESSVQLSALSMKALEQICVPSKFLVTVGVDHISAASTGWTDVICG